MAIARARPNAVINAEATTNENNMYELINYLLSWGSPVSGASPVPPDSTSIRRRPGQRRAVRNGCRR
jgi:hypothetical protein